MDKLQVDIHEYYTRSKDKLSTDKVNLELTKRAFFYKGATLFNDCMQFCS